MANKETRVYKSDTLEQFRQKSNDVSLHLGDNEQLNSNLSDKTYNYVDVSAGDFIFKDTDDDSKAVRFEVKPEESLDNTAGYIILVDSPTIGTYFANGNTISQSGGYSATIESIVGTEKILVKNSSGTFNAAQDLTATDIGDSNNTSTIANANVVRVEAESFNIGVVRVYKNGTELSQNLLEGGFHVPNYVASIALSNSPDVSEFTEGSYVYQNGSQLTTESAVTSNSNWYGKILKATSTELLLKISQGVNSNFSATSKLRLLGSSDEIAANKHADIIAKATSYGVAIELNNEASANDDIKIFSMDVVASINELQDDVGVTENLTTTATNLTSAVNEIESVFDASTYEISAGGNSFSVTSGTFTLDSNADIILDADGADVILKDGGSEYGRLTNASGQLQLKSNGSNVFLTASNTNATFNNNLVVEGTLDVDGNFKVGASKFNVIATSGNTQIDGTLDVDGNVTFDSNATVVGNLTVNGTTTDLNTNLEVSGTGAFTGAVGIDGNFDINTNKFTVAASSGNTVIAGTLDIGSLDTTAQDVLSAINEHESDIGQKSSLTTSAKGNLVAAINELDLKQGGAALTTTATTLSGAVNELVSGKMDLSNNGTQTLDTDVSFTGSGNIFTFQSGTTLSIASGASLLIAGSAAGVSTFGVSFLEVDGNETANGMGLQVARDHISSAPLPYPAVQWRESRVTAGDPEKAWQVVGLNSAGTGSETQDLVTFYNAYHLFANNNEAGIQVNWDSTNQNFDVNVNDPTLTFTGDVTGSGTITNLGNTSIPLTIQPNSVALGTDTTGNYIASVVGTTNEVTVSGNSGDDGRTITVGLPNNVTIGNNLTVNGNTTLGNATSDTVSVAGDLTITGDLTVNGTETILNTATLEVEDSVIITNSAQATVGEFGIAVKDSNGNIAHTLFYDMTQGQWEADGNVLLDNANSAVVPEVKTNGGGSGELSPTTLNGSRDLDLIQGSGIDISGAVNGTDIDITITNTDKGSDVMTFKNIFVSGQSQISADSNTDTLSLAAGNAMVLTTNAGNDTVTFAHADTSSLNGTTGGNNNGIVIEDITVDSNGHVTGVGTRDLDGRFYQQSQFTAANTASTPVLRNSSGNFNAGTITATLSGTATNANNINVDEKNDNVTYQILFSDTNDSGFTRPYIDTDNSHLTYNPSTGRLTVPSINATLLGNGASITSINASNISSGTIPDARLPNTITSSITGNSATATRLATARNIGGVSFNGTANINLPGVNTAGNQNTSGNAATATKLATARTISLGGDASGSISFDGSSNKTITVAVANDSHTHDSRYFTESEINNFFSGTTAKSGYNKSNWDTAYGWGNHASAGYAASSGNMTQWKFDTSGNGSDNTITNNEVIRFAGSGATSVTHSGNTITISSTDNNTTYSAGNGISLSGTTFSVAGGTGLSQTSSGLQLNSTNTNLTSIMSPNSSTTLTLGSTNTTHGNLSYVIDTYPTHAHRFYDGTTEIVRFGFPDMSGTDSIHCEGDIVAYSSSLTSDIKLKENVVKVENALDKVLQLEGVTFNWKKNGQASAGVIAQNVEEVFPSAVSEHQELNSDQVNKHVDYNQLSALFIEAIKELKEENKLLKAEIESLKDINSNK
jgi:hypothetical protein